MSLPVDAKRFRAQEIEDTAGGHRLGCKFLRDDASLLYVHESQITPESEQLMAILGSLTKGLKHGDPVVQRVNQLIGVFEQIEPQGAQGGAPVFLEYSAVQSLIWRMYNTDGWLYQGGTSIFLRPANFRRSSPATGPYARFLGEIVKMGPWPRNPAYLLTVRNRQQTLRYASP